MNSQQSEFTSYADELLSAANALADCLRDLRDYLASDATASDMRDLLRNIETVFDNLGDDLKTAFEWASRED